MSWPGETPIDFTNLPPERARALRTELAGVADLEPAARWARISREMLRPEDPFALHWSLFEANYHDWNPGRGPRPAVLPDPATTARSNVGAWIRELGLSSYAELHRLSIADAAAFTGRAAGKLGLRFHAPPEAWCDLRQGVEHPRWFPGARLNIAESARQDGGDRTAIVFQRENGPLERWPLDALWSLSGRVAHGLQGLRLNAGDAVAIAMPMTALAVAIYLGVVRAGLVVASIADSFAAAEIATRLDIAHARTIFTQDAVLRGGQRLPLYARVKAAGAPRAIVVETDGATAALREGDVRFDDFLPRQDAFSSLPCAPDDPINILFSSGTTGEPKAIPWDHVTPVRAALDGLVHQDLQAGDVVAWPTNLGWMMGPWLIFAALINRATIALYDGSPLTRGFGEFVQHAGVTVLGVVPSLVRAWKDSGCMAGLDWSRIKLFSSTGESSNAADMLYLMSLAGYRPVIEYCGGTEVGGGYLSSTVIQPNSPACFSARTLGLDSIILDEDGQPADAGELYLVPPAIGLSVRLLNGDHAAVYFEGCPAAPDGRRLRRHGDQMQSLPGGYFRALGRSDDTMNLGGVKVSSVELERAMRHAPGVVETAAVAVTPAGGGPSQLVVYAVTAEDAGNDEDALREALQREIRERINPLFKITAVIRTSALPRTASNKVMRRELRKRYRPG